MLKREINEDIFSSILTHYQTALKQGREADLDKYLPGNVYEHMSFNTAVFAAFRARQIQNDLLEILLDDNGVIMPFEEYSIEAKIHLRNTFGNHLLTECDQIVKRMHEWAEWEEFYKNEDIMPNLKWMPTTSATPDSIHQVFWSIPLILPVSSHKWSEHRPGDRWGCKCTLEATDEPATQEDLIPVVKGYKKDPGISVMVGGLGIIFDGTHPAFNRLSPYLDMDEKKLAEEVYKIVVNRHGIRPPKSIEVRPNWSVSKDGMHYTTEDGTRVNAWADGSEIEDNLNTAKTIKRDYPGIDIEIREHLRIKWRKNPEYLIDGLISDAKRVKTEGGVLNAFRASETQDAKILVIDFDKNMGTHNLKTMKIARILRNREEDFRARVPRCYVVHGGRSVLITLEDILLGEVHLINLLEKVRLAGA